MCERMPLRRLHASLVVVIAWRALGVERRVVDRGFPDRRAPLVLGLLAWLDGGRTACHCFGDDVRDVLGLLLVSIAWMFAATPP